MKDKKKLAIIMLGAPGSGKGTQGELLEKTTGFSRYVMSDLIKKELKKGTPLYDRVFKQGILLGDSDIFSIFNKYFKSESDVIIDGIPRTLDQSYWLYGYLMKHEYEIKIIYLGVDEKKLIKRITSRYYCSKCHHPYNTIVKKPKVSGKCDLDGSDLLQREDDTKETFTDRMKIFDEVKDVILKVYEGEVIEINGDQSIEEVGQDVMKNIILRK